MVSDDLGCDRSRQWRLAICCGLPRSGSTLQYQLAAEIVESAGAGRALGWIGAASVDDVIEQLPRGKVGVVKVHHFQQLHGVTRADAGGSLRLIHSYRDLRDVAVSLSRLSGRSFRDIVVAADVERMIADSIQWESCESVMLSRYEDFVGDVGREAGRIAAHLDLDLPVDLLDHFVDHFSLERQRDRTAELRSDSIGYDPTTLLHRGHIGSGAAEQWRSLSMVERAYLERVAGDWLSRHQYALSTHSYQRQLAAARYLTRYIDRARNHRSKGTLVAAVRRRFIDRFR